MVHIGNHYQQKFKFRSSHQSLLLWFFINFHAAMVYVLIFYNAIETGVILLNVDIKKLFYELNQKIPD